MLSSDTCIDLAKLKTGDLNRGEWEDLYIGIDRLTKAGIYIDDTPGISLMEMKNKFGLEDKTFMRYINEIRSYLYNFYKGKEIVYVRSEQAYKLVSYEA